MGVEIHLRHDTAPVRVERAIRVSRVSREVEVLRYGKKTTATETWLLLFSDHEGTNLIGQFRDEDVTGFRYYEKDTERM